jgi:hypothetical protein
MVQQVVLKEFVTPEKVPTIDIPQRIKVVLDEKCVDISAAQH